MTRAEKRKIKYRAIVNYIGDTPQARALRDRSNEYLLLTYGIKIPKELPDIKKPAESTIKKRQTEINKIKLAVESGISNDVAFKFKKLNKAYIKEMIKLKGVSVINEVETKYTKTPSKQLGRNDDDGRMDRMDLWSDYAKADYFPAEIVQKANEINLKNGFDPYASYGYTVVFYAYVELEKTSVWEKRLEADEITQTAIYRSASRRA